MHNDSYKQWKKNVILCILALLFVVGGISVYALSSGNMTLHADTDMEPYTLRDPEENINKGRIIGWDKEIAPIYASFGKIDGIWAYDASGWAIAEEPSIVSYNEHDGLPIYDYSALYLARLRNDNEDIDWDNTVGIDNDGVSTFASKGNNVNALAYKMDGSTVYKDSINLINYAGNKALWESFSLSELQSLRTAIQNLHWDDQKGLSGVVDQIQSESSLTEGQRQFLAGLFGSTDIDSANSLERAKKAILAIIDGYISGYTKDNTADSDSAAIIPNPNPPQTAKSSTKKDNSKEINALKEQNKAANSALKSAIDTIANSQVMIQNLINEQNNRQPVQVVTTSTSSSSSSTSDGVSKSEYDKLKRSSDSKIDELNSTIKGLRDDLNQANTIHTVTFTSQNNDGTYTYVTERVRHGLSATKPADPKWDEHVFCGWKQGETGYVFGTAVNRDITLVADWRPLYSATIAFDWNLRPDALERYNNAISKYTFPQSEGLTVQGTITAQEGKAYANGTMNGLTDWPDVTYGTDIYGYYFTGWRDQNGTLIKEYSTADLSQADNGRTITLYGTWEQAPLAYYRVSRWIQRLDGNANDRGTPSTGVATFDQGYHNGGYELYDTNVYSGQRGAQVNVQTPNIVGFTCITTNEKANLGYDDTPVPVDLYYTRNNYTLTIGSADYAVSTTINGNTENCAAGDSLTIRDIPYDSTVTMVFSNIKEGYKYSNVTGITPTSIQLIDVNGDTTTDAGRAKQVKITFPLTAGNATVGIETVPITYTIRYSANGGTGTVADQTGIPYGYTGKLRANLFTKLGSHFVGWKSAIGDIYGVEKSGNEDWDGAVTIAPNNLSNEDGDIVTLLAQWRTNIYKIIAKRSLENPGKAKVSLYVSGNFVGDTAINDTIDSGEVPYNTQYSVVATPFTGYKVTGWSNRPDDSNITISGNVIGNLEIRPVVEPIHYTVHFNAGNASGTAPSDIAAVYDSNITIPGAGELTKEGYHFVGWDDGAHTYGTPVSGNSGWGSQIIRNITAEDGATINLTPLWAKNTYKIMLTQPSHGSSEIVYHNSTAVHVTELDTEYGDSVSILSTADTGYKTSAWDGPITQAEQDISGQDTYYRFQVPALTSDTAVITPIISPIEYDIAFNKGADDATGDVPDTITNVAYNSNAVIPGPGSLRRTGYHFVGWTDGTNTYGTPATGNNNWTGGTYQNLTAEDGATVQLTALWAKNNYTVNIGSPIAHGTAKITAHNSTDKDVSTLNVQYGDIVKVKATADTGYKTVSWNKPDGVSGGSVTTGQDTEYAFTVPELTADTMTITPVIEAKPYTIRYNGNGGTISGSGEATYTSAAIYDDGGSLEENRFTRANYHFMGWSTDPSDAVGISNFATGTTYATRAINDSTNYPYTTEGDAAYNAAESGAVRHGNMTTEEITVNVYAIWAKDAYSVSLSLDNRRDETAVWESGGNHNLVQSVRVNGVAPSQRVEVGNTVTIGAALTKASRDTNWIYVDNDAIKTSYGVSWNGINQGYDDVNAPVLKVDPDDPTKDKVLEETDPNTVYTWAKYIADTPSGTVDAYNNLTNKGNRRYKVTIEYSLDGWQDLSGINEGALSAFEGTETEKSCSFIMPANAVTARIRSSCSETKTNEQLWMPKTQVFDSYAMSATGDHTQTSGSAVLYVKEYNLDTLTVNSKHIDLKDMTRIYSSIAGTAPTGHCEHAWSWGHNYLWVQNINNETITGQQFETFCTRPTYRAAVSVYHTAYQDGSYYSYVSSYRLRLWAEGWVDS